MSQQHNAEVRAAEDPTELLGHIAVDFQHWLTRPHFVRFQLRAHSTDTVFQFVDLEVDTYAEGLNRWTAFRVPRTEWERIKDRL